MKIRLWIAILLLLAVSSMSPAPAGPGTESGGPAIPAGHAGFSHASVHPDGDDDDDDDDDDDGGPCSQTALLMFGACRAEVVDDFFNARANCIQILDAEERTECFVDTRTERRETNALCREQRAARIDLCGQVGPGRYDPDFDPDLFVEDYTSSVPNPYYPLVIGYRWAFEAEDESNVIEVLPKTKLIEGVNCIVINDLVTAEEGGEDTDDWYAQRFDGTVDYCGEEVQDFEFFEGDNPQEPEVVAIDGSFKHGRDGDLAGTIMLASPEVGDAYRQEMSLGNAEDSAVILSTTYGYGDGSDFDAFAPQELVENMCDNDCLVIGEFTPIEPELFDLKYYAHGIGLFLEVNPDSGEINELVECNIPDSRCDEL